MKDKPTADVSIVAANYNNGRYLGEFIQSIADSTMLPRELIIVDDGSTDESVEILRGFKHLVFLKVIRFEKNKGFTAALNAGLEIAGSKYIMRADPDDRLMPERIEKQNFYLEQHPEVDMVGSNAIYFSISSGKPVNRTNFPLHHNEIVQTILRGEHGLLHATVCGKSAIYKKYRYQNISPGEDYELFARMTKDGCSFANLVEPLYLIRVHPQSSSSRLRFEDIAQTFRFRDQIFGTKTSKIRIWMYYHHIRLYRAYLISGNPVKYAFLAISIMCYPAKLLKRLL